MNQNILIPWIVGTIVCALGLFSRPRKLYEFLRPRFVVPGMIWFAVFFQVIAYDFLREPTGDIYQQCRELAGADSLWFTTLCVSMFWVGHILPIGKKMAVPLSKLDREVYLNPRMLNVVGLVMVFAATAFFILVSGMGAITGGDRYPLIPVPGIFVASAATIYGLMSLTGALILGYFWPPKEERTIFTAPVRIFAISVACVGSMANFSRGSCLPIALCGAAYAVRYRRVGWVFFLSLYFAMAGSIAGLSGRGLYGHYGGLIPYLGHFWGYAFWQFSDALLYAAGAADAFTPQCVVRRASEMMTWVQTTPSDFVGNQLPLPRLSGLLPDYNTDVTVYLGGQGTWGYTLSIIGDVQAHLGNWGSLFFIAWGVLYRMVDRLAFRDGGELTDSTGLKLQTFVPLLFVSYYGLLLGLFNTHRSQVVIFFFSMYALVLALLVWRFFTGTRPQTQLQYNGEEYGDEYSQPAASI